VPAVEKYRTLSTEILFGFCSHHRAYLPSLTHLLLVMNILKLQFVYWSWISNSMYHGFMGYMQGMNTSEVIQRIDDILWDTQKAQWAFWIPIQLLN
jgi:Mpv17 / PMP22 family